MKQTSEVSRSAPVRHRKSVVRRLEMLLAASLQKERRWKCCWRRGYRRSVAENAVGGAVLKSPAAGRLHMDAREQITAAFRNFAFYSRNSAAHFTAAFRTFAFYRRNYSAHFTAAFCTFALCRRNSAAHFTAAFRTFAFCCRNSAAHFTVAFRALHCPPNGRV